MNSAIQLPMLFEAEVNFLVMITFSDIDIIATQMIAN